VTNPIGPIPPHHPPISTVGDTLLARQMQDQIGAVIETLEQILQDPTLCDQPSYLGEVAEKGKLLDHTAQQAIQGG